MTVREILKVLPENSILEWEEYDYDEITETYVEDEEMSDLRTLKDFLEGNGYSYRTRDLEVTPDEDVSIVIKFNVYENCFHINISRYLR